MSALAVAIGWLAASIVAAAVFSLAVRRHRDPLDAIAPRVRVWPGRRWGTER